MAKVYQAIASAMEAARNCAASGNNDWLAKHSMRIEMLVRDHMPSGSGFDSGTQFDIVDHLDDKRARLVFETDFHHMDENGHYGGWTHHSVIVTPSFSGFDLRVTGRNRNGIKEYIGDFFHAALDSAAE